MAKRSPRWEAGARSIWPPSRAPVASRCASGPLIGEDGEEALRAARRPPPSLDRRLIEEKDVLPVEPCDGRKFGIRFPSPRSAEKGGYLCAYSKAASLFFLVTSSSLVSLLPVTSRAAPFLLYLVLCCSRPHVSPSPPVPISPSQRQESHDGVNHRPGRNCALLRGCLLIERRPGGSLI